MGGAQWRAELELIGKLSTLNQDIARYVVRSLDADAGRTQPTSPADEAALGVRLVEVGTVLQDRARDRQATIVGPIEP